MIFYYSGCGNSRHVAERVAAATGERLVFIPQATREEAFHYPLQDDERVGFVFPIYSWRPPQLVLDFVSRVDVEGQPGYVYMVATYGGDSGMTGRVFKEALGARGLRLDAVFGVTMPNTYVNMSFMNIDSEEVAARKLKAAEGRIAGVCEAVVGRRHVVDIHKGSMARFKTFVIGAGFNRWLSDDKYYSTDACVSCGRCVEVCPLENITLVEGRPRWNGHCTQCEACYHYCPQNAVQFGRATRGKGQYHFDERKG